MVDRKDLKLLLVPPSPLAIAKRLKYLGRGYRGHYNRRGRPCWARHNLRLFFQSLSVL